MACVSGQFHTITLSNDGVVYSFGRNNEGQLGLSCNSNISLPCSISSLPKIKQVSCGGNFTVCVDEEGFLWSFGNNSFGQLGTGNTTYSCIPLKIPDIPPVLSVACGETHIIIIANDSDMWSCGNNYYGQLCLGEKKVNQSTFQKTSFTNITRVSCGYGNSLFQNEKGEIYSCGKNDSGESGLGHFNSPITPSFIPNLPSNIINFVCGNVHCLFLDVEGKVFAVGDNQCGQLGLGHFSNQNILTQIPNIPPIQSISCVSHASYLIDYDGNVWSFGYNGKGQLGLGKTRKDIKLPIKVERLKDIEQISYGCCGTHFFAKDSQNRIFETGAKGTTEALAISITIYTPKEIDSKYFAIWGDIPRSKCKSARK